MIYRRTVKPIMFHSPGARRITIEISYNDTTNNLNIRSASISGYNNLYVLQNCLRVPPASLRADASYTKGWNHQMCRALREIWIRYNNNMNSFGDEYQKRLIRNRIRERGIGLEYWEASTYLSNMGHNTHYVHEGHRYGSEYVPIEVPSRVLSWLFSLPGTGDEYSCIALPDVSGSELEELLMCIS